MDPLVPTPLMILKSLFHENLNKLGLWELRRSCDHVQMVLLKVVSEKERQCSPKANEIALTTSSVVRLAKHNSFINFSTNPWGILIAIA